MSQVIIQKRLSTRARLLMEPAAIALQRKTVRGLQVVVTEFRPVVPPRQRLARGVQMAEHLLRTSQWRSSSENCPNLLAWLNHLTGASSQYRHETGINFKVFSNYS